MTVAVGKTDGIFPSNLPTAATTLNKERSRSSHARGSDIDTLEAGAKADEVSVVSFDEADELGTEGDEVGSDLGDEAVEGHEGVEVGDVDVRVEVGTEEGLGIELWLVRLDGLAEEVRWLMRRHHDEIRHGLDLRLRQ
ncbi:hypothetical protein GUJ93_ZPchr0003g17669 [Zizania palustris]|uniref:Uncharacterized protein n=1 Tax=Zizania palustris TaxID=103762 RepID=A0A8J5S0T4_ZIZPA|nr:hypothetical protein GUJ93_ZPchr0003g17669 [Zizania palustris]